MAIIEGEVAIRAESGHELIRHGPSGFVGELNLLTGQTVFLEAMATEPLRYIAVDRMELRELLFDNPDLADLLLPAFVSRRELLQCGGRARHRGDRPAFLRAHPRDRRVAAERAHPLHVARSRASITRRRR